jgi:hypothetical protein
MMTSLAEKHGGRGREVVLARWVAACRDLPESLKDAVAIEAGRVFYEEKNRERDANKTRRYTIERKGKQLQLTLYEQSYGEGHTTVAREEANVRGAAEQAAFDRFVIVTSEKLCRERGLEPTANLIIGDYLTPEEAKAAWDERSAA